MKIKEFLTSDVGNLFVSVISISVSCFVLGFTFGTSWAISLRAYYDNAPPTKPIITKPFYELPE